MNNENDKLMQFDLLLVIIGKEFGKTPVELLDYTPSQIFWMTRLIEKFYELQSKELKKIK